MTQTTLTGVRRAQGGIAERMFFSPAGLCSIAVSCVYLVVAVGFFNRVGLSEEAATRTAHLTNLVAGYEQSVLAFGLERPPLPTLLGMLFATVPEFRPMGLAVAIGIALTGGLSVAVANGIGRWAGLGSKTHLIFVAAFAFHPLLLISSASGMSEALYTTLLLAAFGQLLRWLDRESTTPLILAGVACGAAFLLRYDVLWIAAAIALCVYYVALTREVGIENLERAQATTVAFIVPVAFVVGFWTITACSPTATCSSSYTQQRGSVRSARTTRACSPRRPTCAGIRSRQPHGSACGPYPSPRCPCSPSSASPASASPPRTEQRSRSPVRWPASSCPRLPPCSPARARPTCRT